MKYILLLTSLFIIIGCSKYPQTVETSLALAGNNRKELERVIKFYKDRNEKEKLQAVYFLISNMKDKGSFVVENFDNNIQSFNSNNMMSKSEYSNIIFVPDLQNITAKYLVNNIENSFKVRNTSPFCAGLSDQNFYEYILPYRISDEKLEYWRDSVKSFLSPYIDTIYKLPSVLSAANFIDNIYQKEFKFCYGRYFNEKRVRSYTELMHDKEGKCSDMCSIVTMALRTLGIPCGIDYIPYKRASDDVGHEWCFVLDHNSLKTYPFDALSNNGPGLFNLLYKNAPKVLRNQYSISKNLLFENHYQKIHPSFNNFNSIDITNLYYETAEIAIEINELSKDPLYLCVWNNGNWKPIDCFYDTITTQVIFNNVSKNNLYTIISYGVFGNKQVNEPFIVNNLAEIKYISNYGEKKETSLRDYNNRALSKMGNNTIIYYFDGIRPFKEIALKQKNDSLGINKWILSDSLFINQLYYISDTTQSTGRIIVLNENKSIDWF